MDNHKTETTLFTSLFNRYKEPFILFANSYVKDLVVAEDIYMEAMIDFWEKRRTSMKETNVPAYILTTIKNKALNHLRHLCIKTEVESNIYSREQKELKLRILSLDDCDPSELFVDDVKQIIRKVYEELPPRTRKIFYMSRVEHKKNKEIAEKMNLSVKSIEFHISKALKVFAVRLKDYLSILLLLF